MSEGCEFSSDGVLYELVHGDAVFGGYGFDLGVELGVDSGEEDGAFCNHGFMLTGV